MAIGDFSLLTPIWRKDRTDITRFECFEEIGEIIADVVKKYDNVTCISGRNFILEDFMFQLSKEEMEFVKSQIATSRNINFFEGQEGGRRKLPYAFSEQGIYMLATVLRGEVARRGSNSFYRKWTW